MTAETRRRYWTECKCGSFKSAEGLDDFFPLAEAAEHLLAFRLTDARVDHETFVRWRAVEAVRS